MTETILIRRVQRLRGREAHATVNGHWQKSVGVTRGTGHHARTLTQGYARLCATATTYQALGVEWVGP